MANVKPFRAIRPTRDKVALVTTRSYDLYSKKERKTILRMNPFSFLHILRPGYKYQKNLKGTLRFQMVHNRYNEFKENHIFTRDDKPIYYLHQKQYKDSVFWGIIGLASVDDYRNDVIKKHEKTLSQREALFGDYLEISGFNAEPVLITYPDNDFLNGLIHKYRNKRAEYEFTTNKERTHLLWCIEDQEEIDQISSEFESIPSLYIADGHHRTASSKYLCEKVAEGGDEKTKALCSHFMAYFISESSLRITSFYRFVKSLNGLSKKEFLISLDQHFRIKNLGHQYYQPGKPHHFSMYLDGDYYQLYLRRSALNQEDILDELDSHILYKTVLQPILGINDLTKDANIEYLPEEGNELQLKNLVDTGQFVVGFGSYPISVDQLKQVADDGLTMPPKSTYIEPKLRSGLTIYQLK